MFSLKNLIEYGFYLFIIILPWQTRLIYRDASLNGFTWEYGRFSLYATELILWLVLFFYGFWLWRNKKLTGLKFNQALVKLKKPAVLIYCLAIIFILWAGLSISWSLDAGLSYYSFFRLAEAGALFSLVVVFGFRIYKLAIAWVLSSGLQSVFAIWQFFIQLVPENKWLGLAYQLPNKAGSIILQTDSERWLRAYGSLPHPNMLAGFLVIALLFLLYLAFVSDKRHQRVFILASLVVIVPALFFSFSRSAWIALFCALVLLFFWLFRYRHLLWQKTFFKLLFLVLILISVLGLNLSEPLVSRILTVEPLEVSSIELRFTYTDQALSLFKNNWLFGVGVGNYTLAVFKQLNSGWPGHYYQPVHNIFLLVLVELGVFGAAVLGLILLLLFWQLAKQVSSLEKIISFLALFVILIIGLFDHYFWSFYFGIIIFWLILGLNLKSLKNPSSNN